MRWHTVDYLERDTGRRAGRIFDRGFWLNDVPRLIPLCRLLGHDPVVDGTQPLRAQHGRGSRWVCCDRCGIRPEPLGSLDPDEWNIGQPYTGPWIPALPTDPAARREAAHAFKDAASYPPGPWPANPTTSVGGQLVLGKVYSTSLQIKIGNKGSEQVLAGHITISPLGALYLHTENHGTWLQRRINPTGYESREIGFSAHDGRCFWSLWAPRNSWSSTDPKWWQGSFRIDPRDILLGDKRYSYDNVGDPVAAVLRMPHGDDHQVRLQLKRQTLTRARRRRPVEQTWTVEIRAEHGIPTKTGRSGGTTVFSVTVQDDAVEHGHWATQACAQGAVRLTRDRVRYGYRPTAEASA
jgi:hypothetical protein